MSKNIGARSGFLTMILQLVSIFQETQVSIMRSFITVPRITFWLFLPMVKSRCRDSVEKLVSYSFEHATEFEPLGQKTLIVVWVSSSRKFCKYIERVGPETPRCCRTRSHRRAGSVLAGTAAAPRTLCTANASSRILALFASHKIMMGICW